MAVMPSAPDPTDQRNVVAWTCQNLINGVSYSWGEFEPQGNVGPNTNTFGNPDMITGTTTGTVGATGTED